MMNCSSMIAGALLLYASACVQPGAKYDRVAIGDDTYRVEWLHNESFDEGWEDRWVAECDSCSLWVENNKLHINDYNGATIWNVDEYPQNLIVRYKVKGLKREENRTNFNLITHAREPDGSPLVIGEESGRNGVYKTYHEIPNYLTTFVYKWTRLRRNPGFNLLSDVPEASTTDMEYEVVFAINEERLRCYINGVKYHDEQNDQPQLPGGKVGIRTWNTLAQWYDMEIGKLVDN